MENEEKLAICSECDRPAFCRGWCQKHYYQWYAQQPGVREREQAKHRRLYWQDHEKALAKLRRKQDTDHHRRYKRDWERAKTRALLKGEIQCNLSMKSR